MRCPAGLQGLSSDSVRRVTHGYQRGVASQGLYVRLFVLEKAAGKETLFGGSLWVSACVAVTMQRGVAAMAPWSGRRQQDTRRARSGRVAVVLWDVDCSAYMGRNLLKKSCGVTIRSPVRAARASFQCSWFAEITQSGYA